MNYTDPSGHLAFWVVAAIIGAAVGVGITAAVDYIPDQEFNLHWGWYVGAGLLGATVAVTFGYTYDDNDNFGFYATVSIGAGTPSAGISGSVTKTNAPTIYDQRGWGLSMGGSVSPAIPFLSVGGDYNMLLDDTFSPAYSGVTTNVGVGVGLPAEWHGTFDYTWVWGWNKRNLWR